MNSSYGLGFPLIDHVLTFTINMEHLVVTSKTPDAATGLHTSYAYAVSDGLVLQYDDATKELTVLQDPPIDYDHFQAFMALHGPYASVGIDLERLVLQAGGFGVMDIIDTDPFGTSYRELPLKDFQILATGVSHTVMGVQIQRKKATSAVVTFQDGATYSAYFGSDVSSDGLLFTVYYA